MIIIHIVTIVTDWADFVRMELKGCTALKWRETATSRTASTAVYL